MPRTPSFSRRPRTGLALAALTAVVAAFVPAAGAGAATPPPPVAAIVPRVAGPIAYLTCPPAPRWCTRKLRAGHGRFPGVTLTHLQAHMRRGHGATENIYKLSWKLNDPWVHLAANAVNPPTSSGRIRLGTISHWASWGAPRGLVAALNGDFFGFDWMGSTGVPSGMLVHARRIVAPGYGGPTVAFRTTGAPIFATPRTTAIRLPLTGGRYATVGAFVDPQLATSVSTQIRALVGDQVGVYTVHDRVLHVPAGFVGVIAGSPSAPSPFRGVLHGERRIVGSNGTGETAVGFRFDVAGAAGRAVALPAVTSAACPGYLCPAGASLTLGAGQALLIARAGSRAALGLAARVAGADHAVLVPLDDAGWQDVTDVMGGKPWLVRDGVAANATPGINAPGMSGDCWQWCQQHWRPAFGVSTNGYGWMIVTGAPNGTGVYGWDWSKMLVQLGARDAIGFDNNSSTELYAPAAGIFSLYSPWQRSIAETTSVAYHR